MISGNGTKHKEMVENYHYLIQMISAERTTAKLQMRAILSVSYLLCVNKFTVASSSKWSLELQALQASVMVTLYIHVIHFSDNMNSRTNYY